MAENKHTGGPAFPTLPTYDAAGYPEQSADGMTLRDWFAGKALSGLMADPNEGPTDEEELPEFYRNIAESAFQLADAMLAERSKT